jgi:hypothetical protein
MENWKTVFGFEDYQISDLGRVKSLKYNKEKILKPILNNTGYLCVNLGKKSKFKLFQIHQLVAIAFLNHKPNGYEKVVDHINNIKTDNALINLQIISNRENVSKDSNGISKYTGVAFNKKCKKWQSYININSKAKYLGLFKTELEASNAYQNELFKLNNF